MTHEIRLRPPPITRADKARRPRANVEAQTTGADLDQQLTDEIGPNGKATKSSASKKVGFFQHQLLAWYEDHGRRFSWREPSCTLFAQVLAEILLQRTRAERVDKVLQRMIKAVGSWQAIAESSTDELETYLKTLGLWRRRVAALQQFATEMCRRKGDYPRTREELESLPAVGQYIANAILLLVHSQPQPLLDVNMARLLERFFGQRHLADIRYDPYLQNLSRFVLIGVDAKRINWAIMDFAAVVCRTHRPTCHQCPLRSRCRYYKSQTQ
jgi:A/G-specific adenine glycosylase